PGRRYLRRHSLGSRSRPLPPALAEASRGPMTSVLAADKGQPFVLCEVGEVLDVEGGKREIIDKAAGGYPGVVLRAGPSASLRAGLELAPFLRHRFVVCQNTDTLTPAGQFAGAARPPAA